MAEPLSKVNQTGLVLKLDQLSTRERREVGEGKRRKIVDGAIVYYSFRENPADAERVLAAINDQGQYNLPDHVGYIDNVCFHDEHGNNHTEYPFSEFQKMGRPRRIRVTTKTEVFAEPIID